MAVPATKRKSNIEWMRVLAMLMVVTLHALGKGGLLEEGAYNQVPGNWTLAWAIESAAIVAVNLYVLISGYCLAEAEFKSGRLVNLILQILFYALGGFLVFSAIGVPGDKGFYELLRCLLPIHMDTYWFMTSYVVLYLFLPILVRALRGMERGQLKLIILFLLIYECGFKTFLPVKLGIEDNGYSFLWFLILFLTAAYFKKFGFGIIAKPLRGIALFAICAALIFAEGFAINYIALNYGHLELLGKVSYDYNHLFVYLGAIGIFSWGINLKDGEGKAAAVGVFLGKYTLGVYLLHENPLIRYEWVRWFKLDTVSNASVGMFLLTLLTAVLGVFCAGIAIDFLRTMLFKLIGGLKLFEPLKNIMKKMDRTINGTETA